jgi:hypothetical protein
MVKKENVLESALLTTVQNTSEIPPFLDILGKYLRISSFPLCAYCTPLTLLSSQRQNSR